MNDHPPIPDYDRLPDLAERHVIVTGASRGIGLAIARALAECRARVSLVSRTARDIESARATLANAAEHAAFATDVTDAGAVDAMVEAAAARLGPVFALVNNAGTGDAVAFVDGDDAHWRRMIDVNLMSAVFCTRAVLPGMIQRREGRVVNIASTAAIRGYRHVAAYSAAKHALLGLTRSLAREVERDGVLVRAVCPGYTETDLLAESIRAASRRTGKSEQEIRARFESSNRGGRLVRTDEIAHAVAWLCGERAVDLSGAGFVLDGGPPEVLD
ncbi:MAG TPA: SDR family oxidoreductase [Candidatus Krumholzibacteria bacterium]